MTLGGDSIVRTDIKVRLQLMTLTRNADIIFASCTRASYYTIPLSMARIVSSCGVIKNKIYGKHKR